MALYKGQGGAVFDIEPPEDGQRKERFDAQLANGDLVLVEPPSVPKPAVSKPAAKPAQEK